MTRRHRIGRDPQLHFPTGDLAAPDHASFEFISDVGFKYKGDGRSVIFANASVTKPGAVFNDQELFAYGSALQRYFDAIAGLTEQNYTSAGVLGPSSFRAYRSRYGYKFVTEETYYEYVLKGSFLVSSLARYREMEEQGNPAGDRFEGSAHSAYLVGDRQLTVSTLSGFDTHIFSLARDLKNVDEMKARFGSVILRIELLPFARSLAGLVDKVRADIRLVRYADLKLYRGALSLLDVAGFPPNLTDRLARALRENGRLPSIFAKPGRFESEREVRIAMTASSDVPDKTVVEDRKLLKFVERIDT